MRDGARATALPVVSTGTTVGVIAAAGLAFGVAQGALDWRGAWVGFAIGALGLAVVAWFGVPPRRRPKPTRSTARQTGHVAPAEPVPEASPADVARELSFFRRDTIPLYAAAFCFGMTNAIFLSFAVDRVVGAGGLPGLQDRVASAVIFLGYGFFGVFGLATGRVEGRIGLAPLLCLIYAAGAVSLVLIGLVPTSWSGVIAAAGLHGAAIMMVSAVLSF
ncbi:hypothetical protein U5903_22215, partial [Cereibacter johrii]|uniref:MFS transporter n=1 Tax=Cereibacter johrii TaxID=445629 RepID=UPI002B20B1B9